MRQIRVLSISNIQKFKKQLLQWATSFEQVCWLDSNNRKDLYSSYEAVLAVDAIHYLAANADNAFQKVANFHQETQDYIFGYLGYDLKNDIEDLSSQNDDFLGFSDVFFFQPKKLFFLKENNVELHYHNSVAFDMDSDIKAIQELLVEEQISSPKLQIQARIPKDRYVEKVNDILTHIHRGDIYEMNFCQEFYATDAVINPWHVYQKLNTISQSPFASFFKIGEKYALCASLERYLLKKGSKVISQPIKGTAKRSKDVKEDEALKCNLATDIKERAENIMIVDLVRNDLSQVAKKGSVTVEELCKVYTFEQVHQMISTIACEVEDDTSPVEVIKATFPMGSMTGAPKIAAMKIIEEQEETKRGLYSGAIGYLTPSGDADFNVVIRSILYHADDKYISYSVGGAITAQTTAEQEYEECMVKAAAMKSVLMS